MTASFAGVLLAHTAEIHVQDGADSQTGGKLLAQGPDSEKKRALEPKLPGKPNQDDSSSGVILDKNKWDNALPEDSFREMKPIAPPTGLRVIVK